MGKDKIKQKEYERNVSLNLIYFGLQHLIWIIDKLGYDYMVEWRNQMCQWQIELEKKYEWLGENIRSWN